MLKLTNISHTYHSIKFVCSLGLGFEVEVNRWLVSRDLFNVRSRNPSMAGNSWFKIRDPWFVCLFRMRSDLIFMTIRFMMIIMGLLDRLQTWQLILIYRFCLRYKFTHSFPVYALLLRGENKYIIIIYMCPIPRLRSSIMHVGRQF